MDFVLHASNILLIALIRIEVTLAFAVVCYFKYPFRSTYRLQKKEICLMLYIRTYIYSSSKHMSHFSETYVYSSSKTVYQTCVHLTHCPTQTCHMSWWHSVSQTYVRLTHCHIHWHATCHDDTQYPRRAWASLMSWILIIQIALRQELTSVSLNIKSTHQMIK